MKDFTTCSVEALAKFKDNFGGEEIKALIQNVDTIIREAGVTGQNPATALRTLLEARERELKISQMQRLATLETNAPHLAKMESHAKPLDLLEGILGIERIGDSGGSKRVAETQMYYQDQAGSFLGRVFDEDPKVLKRLAQNDPDILSNIGKYWDGAPHNLTPSEIKFAEGVRKLYNYQYKAKRSAKIDVAYLENYVGRTRHPPDAIRNMGLQKWQEIMERDFVFTGSRQEIDDALAKSFSDITNRPFKSAWAITDDMTKIETTARGSRLEKSRTFTPKNNESWLNYHRDTGQNYLENIISDITQDSGELAAATVFGPKWRQAIRMNLEAAKVNMTARGEHGNYMKREQKILDIVDMMIYPRSNPAKNLLGNAVVGANRWVDMSKLQMSYLSTMGDLANASGTIGAVTGQSVFKNFGSIFGDYVKNMAPHGMSNVNEIAREVGHQANDFLHANSFDRYGESVSGFKTNADGMMEKIKGVGNTVYKKWMNATLLARTDFALKRAQSAKLARQIARDLGSPYSALSPGAKKSLQRVGLDESKWDILKQAVAETPNAGKIVSVETIQSLDEGLFAGKTKADRIRSRDDLAMRLYNHIQNNVDIAVASSDLKMKQFLSSQDPNTPSGAATIMMMKYKAFPIAVAKTYKYNYQMGGIKTVIPTAGLSMVFAGMAYTARKVIEGTPPDEIVYDHKALLQIALNSGAGGLYADLIGHDRPFVESIAGPTFGMLGDMHHLLQQEKNELTGDTVRSTKGFESDIEEVREKAFKRNMIYFPYTRVIINKAFSEYFQEVVQ